MSLWSTNCRAELNSRISFPATPAIFYRKRTWVAVVILQLLLTSLLLLDCRPVWGQAELKERLKDTIRKYVQAKLHLAENELILEFPNLAKSLRGISAFDQIKIFPARRPIRKGVQLIRCGLLFEGKLRQTLNINVRIRTFQTVVVSKVKLPRLSGLTLEDLELTKLETTSINRPAFSSIQELSGKRTTRFIRAGELITANLVETLPLITRGNEVDIHFERGLLEITTPGIARQDGKIGDKIRVQCVENKKIFAAVILDASTVLVKL